MMLQKYMSRQSVYVYGKKNNQNDPIGEEFAAQCSQADPLTMSKVHWKGWEDVEFYTKQEIKQRVIKHLFTSI